MKSTFAQIRRRRTPPLAPTLLLIGLVLNCVGMEPASAAPRGHPTANSTAYAEKVSRLVRRQDLAALARLAPPKEVNPPNVRIARWQKQYLKVMLKNTRRTQKTFAKQVALAKKQMAAGKIIPAFGHMLAAYALVPNRRSFKRLGWVKKFTAAAAAKAAAYDRRRRWLESLNLYSELNSMYRVSMRYHDLLQRVERRTSLLATYTPREFYQMQLRLDKRFQRKPVRNPPPATQPTATRPVKNKSPVSITFSKWQNSVRGIHQDMLFEALGEAQRHWVLPVTYNRLLIGGIKMVELFPQTSTLGDAFAGLKNKRAREQFLRTLKKCLAAVETKKPLHSNAMFHTWGAIMRSDRHTVHLPTSVLVRAFTDGALGQLDPFTEMFWPSEVPEFHKMMEGTFGGVGIEIAQQNGFLRVISPLRGTPAYRAGIQAGDMIVTVNGKSILGISINGAVRLIMGKPGTYVTLGIRRDHNPKLLTFRLRRARIMVRSVKGFQRNPRTGKWRFMIDRRRRIGYIRVTQFQEDTAKEMQKVLKRLLRRHVRGLIIDLRFNPGGLLEIALRMCNMFLPGGTILSTKGRTVPRQVWSANSSPLVPPAIPMIVLVNQDSASASEIFSGSMKDLHRALILGHRTFGKGSVQNVMSLGAKANARLKLTMEYYYLPDGESIQRRPHARNWGVQPNVTVPFSPQQLVDLHRLWQHNDILPPRTRVRPVSSVKTRKALPEESFDTQLDTALMLMRLQLMKFRSPTENGVGNAAALMK